MEQIIFWATNKNAKKTYQDPSWFYRCVNLGTALQDLGWQVAYRHIASWKPDLTADIAFFHRPQWNGHFWKHLCLLKRRGVKLIADFDDFIFDPHQAQYSPAVLNGILTLEQTAQNFTRHQKVLSYLDTLTVSTQPLADHLAKLIPQTPVVVLPNAVPNQWLKQSNTLTPAKTKLAQPIISYLPGTRSHDRDFQVFQPAIERFLQDYPQVRLRVTGPLNFALNVQENQIIRQEKVPFADYYQQFQDIWVNLAPLEDTPFTRCKSALKVIEAAYWGIPTLCTPIADTARFADTGGIAVTTDSEVYAALQQLLQLDTYTTLTHNLREDVLMEANIHDIAKKMNDLVVII